MSKSIYLAVILIMAVVFSGCNKFHSKASQAQTAVNSSTPYADGARRVTIQELEDLVKENKAVVIDVRNQESYDAGHIPGAKLIPAGEIVNHINELPKDKLIITYCS